MHWLYFPMSKDDENENKISINKAMLIFILNKEFVGKTVIVIAHRLSTIRNLDRILVLEEGRIAEEGNHLSLMELQGKYFDFIRAQNSNGGKPIEFKENDLVH
jgi:ATP-binding cassette, subfamily B, bacterial